MLQQNKTQVELLVGLLLRAETAGVTKREGGRMEGDRRRHVMQLEALIPAANQSTKKRSIVCSG